jgi:hypothetical protein
MKTSESVKKIVFDISSPLQTGKIIPLTGNNNKSLLPALPGNPNKRIQSTIRHNRKKNHTIHIHRFPVYSNTSYHNL